MSWILDSLINIIICHQKLKLKLADLAVKAILKFLFEISGPTDKTKQLLSNFDGRGSKWQMAVALF